MTNTEMLKQEVKEALEFCSGKEFCTIETKLLKGLLDEIDRLTAEGEKAKAAITRIKQAMAYEEHSEDKLIEVQRTLDRLDQNIKT